MVLDKATESRLEDEQLSPGFLLAGGQGGDQSLCGKANGTKRLEKYVHDS